MTEFAIFLMMLSVILFFVSIVMLCFPKTQDDGLKVLLFSIVGFLIGFSLCSMFPIRI